MKAIYLSDIKKNEVITFSIKMVLFLPSRASFSKVLRWIVLAAAVGRTRLVLGYL